ncbi:MAG: hypothetical protein ACJ70U_09485 [Nitrososphaera sp.]
MAIEDSMIELVLVSDKPEQNEILQKSAARSDTRANRLGQIEEKEEVSEDDNNNNNNSSRAFPEESQTFDQYCKESGLPSIRELSDQELNRATRFIDSLFALGDIIAPSLWSDRCRIKCASSSLSSSLSSSNFLSHWLSGIRPLKDSLIFLSKAKLLMTNSWTG